MNRQANRVLEIFTGAAELPAAARAAFLDQSCAGDRDLRGKVERLLQLHERAGDFLEPIVGPAAEKLRAPEIGEKPGDLIGHYKLVEQIGEGGSGVVFLAEQLAPVRRQVALKILKPGMDTRNVIARFEAERQVLALMDHSNIAKVFDAGATGSGRPYFVMELIRGRKITGYCDEQSLSTDERLQLFIRVCHAIQHAHQKGVIHRDIKPSNILVATTPEGAALPVIIDFGIAKAVTSQALGGHTVHTAVEMLIGTPAYMSPEQAASANADVDTRTDIYSLGVLLYELLIGVTPFDCHQLSKSSAEEFRRVVREQDPPRPSARLKQLPAADLKRIAGHRRTEPHKLIRSIHGDLDWIVMKALEKDLTRRYETANSLALDVRHYLAHEAVSARPPSALYKFQKTVRRNQLLFTGLGIITVLVFVSLIAISAALASERHALARATTEAEKSGQITQFLEAMLQGAGPSYSLGRDTTMLREILDRTASRIATNLVNQPAVAAHVSSVIGRLYLDIGQYGQAEKMHRSALAMDQKLFGAGSLPAALDLNDLGMALYKERKSSQARQVEAQSLAIERRLLPPVNSDLADTLSTLSDIYRHEGNDTAAETLTREALKIRETLFTTNSLATAESLRSLSIIRGDQGHWQESEALARQVLVLRRQILGSEHPLVADSLNDVAWTLSGQGRAAEAEALETQALEMRQKLLTADHPDLAMSYYLVGERMGSRGELRQADSLLNTALDIQNRALGDTNQTTLDTANALGRVLEAEGNWPAAEKMRRHAVAMWKLRGENRSPRAFSEMAGLARDLIFQRKFNDAQKMLDDVLAPPLSSEPASAQLLYLRCNLKARQSLFAAAAADAALAFQSQPNDTSHFAELAALLAITHQRAAYDRFCAKIISCYLDTTNPYVADQVAKASLFLPPAADQWRIVSHLADIAITYGGHDQGALPFFQLCKALAEYRQNHFAAAAEWAEKSYHNPRIEAQEHAAPILAMACWQLGKQADARKILAVGESLAPATMPATVAEDPGDGWLAWLFARIQLTEAEQLIQADDFKQ